MCPKWVPDTLSARALLFALIRNGLAMGQYYHSAAEPQKDS
jgi:hypothetical protein